MAKKRENNVVVDSVSASGYLKLKLAIDIAMDHGGFEAVVAVMKHLQDGIAKSEREPGVYAATEWRGLDFLHSLFPGCTKDMGKYI